MILIFVLALLASPNLPAKHESPFACNTHALNAAERKRHFDELGPMLMSLRSGVRELPNGYEFEFPGDAKTAAMLAEWTVQERLCCPFFDIELRFGREGGPVALRLTGREGTKKFLQIDGAEWIKR